MKAIIESMLEEIGAMHSGHFVPYHKTAIVVVNYPQKVRHLSGDILNGKGNF